MPGNTVFLARTHGGPETMKRPTGRKNQNLTQPENAALAQIAAHHGYVVKRGPTAKDGVEAGYPLMLLLAIISGEVVTILLDTDERWHAIQALETSDDEVLHDIAIQLRRAAEREQALEDEDIEQAIEERNALHEQAEIYLCDVPA